MSLQKVNALVQVEIPVEIEYNEGDLNDQELASKLLQQAQDIMEAAPKGCTSHILWSDQNHEILGACYDPSTDGFYLATDFNNGINRTERPVFTI